MADQVRLSVVIAEPRTGWFDERISAGLDYKYIRRQILASTTYRDLIHVEPILEPNLSDLQFEFAETRPHIVHFACHGSPEGIVLRSEHNDGDEWNVGTERLVSLLRETPTIRMVVLNSCDTKKVGKALLAATDFVVSMKKTIEDGPATAFASSFYLGLAHGRSVDEAFSMGRNGIKNKNLPDYSTPQLHVRRGAKSNIPFIESIQRASQGERTATIKLFPPPGMWPADGFEYRVLEVCEGDEQPEHPSALLNNPVDFEQGDNCLVAQVLNAKGGLQYKCMVDLPKPAPSDQQLKAAFAEAKWRDPRPDGQEFDHDNRRWFLIGKRGAKTCRTKEGFVNDFLFYSP